MAEIAGESAVCPEHGRWCGGEVCCCRDKHQPESDVLTQHGPWRVERTWNKHHERIPDRWTWDVVDDAGTVATVVEDEPEESEATARAIADLPDTLAELAELRALVRHVHEWVAESAEARNADNENPVVRRIAPLGSAERVVTISLALLSQKYEHLAAASVTASRCLCPDPLREVHPDCPQHGLEAVLSASPAGPEGA